MQKKPSILFAAAIYAGYSSFNAGDYGMRRNFQLVPHKHAIVALIAWLREHGCDAHYVWMNVGDETGIAKIIEAIERHNPDAVGMSICTDEMMTHYEIIKAIKAKHPDIPIIVGGPHAGAIPEHTLEHFPLIDYIVIGEGENTLTEWLTYIASGRNAASHDIMRIKGLAFRGKDGQIVRTECRERMPDINALPEPAYDALVEQYMPLDPRTAFPLVCSYGCYYECTFCSTLQGWMRAFDPIRVVDRMERLMKTYGIDYFAIPDSLWPPTIGWMNDFCDEIEKRGLKFQFHFLARVGTLTEKHLRRLKRLGCRVIMVGVEVGDPEMMKVIKKKITPGMALRTARGMNSVGIFSVAFYIFGNQGETRKDMQASIDLARRMNSSETFFRALGPLPGSEAFDYVPEEQKDWWMRGAGERDWWMRAVAPSISELTPEQLELLGREAFLLYPLRWAYLWQHVLDGHLPWEFRVIALRIFMIHLRKYILGMGERFSLTRRIIMGLKRIFKR